MLMLMIGTPRRQYCRNCRPLARSRWVVPSCGHVVRRQQRLDRRQHELRGDTASLTQLGGMVQRRYSVQILIKCLEAPANQQIRRVTRLDRAEESIGAARSAMYRCRQSRAKLDVVDQAHASRPSS